MDRRYKYANFNISSDREEDEPISESQDFCLKMTQDTVASSIQETVANNNRDIIVISDSSSDCDSPKHSSNTKLKSIKRFNSMHKERIETSSSSECSDDEANDIFEMWRNDKKINFFNCKKKENIFANRTNVLLTSDSSTPSSSDTNDKCIQSSAKTKSTCINFTPEKNKKVTVPFGSRDSSRKCIESSIKSTNNKFIPECNKKVTAMSSNRDPNGKRIESSTTSTHTRFISESNKKAASECNSQLHITNGHGKNISSHYARINSGRNIDKPQKGLPIENQIEITRKLSRKDVRNILQTIRLPKVAYESPRRKNDVVIDESVDTNVDESMDYAGHPAISFKKNFIESAKIIDETPSSSGSDVAHDSKKRSNNLHRNQVNEILNTQKEKQNVDALSELSERKKKQISEWLQTNSPDSKSDSSFSMVPASNRNGVSSGNSSLERLEVNYETPNNREKIRQAQTSEKKVTNEDCDKIVQTSVTRQTTILDYTKRSRNDGLELRTPINKRTDNVISTPTANEPQNVDIKFCTDILDKLYGTSWRQNADALLSKSEPRNKPVCTKSRAVQTERKVKSKKIIYSSESADEDSSASLDDLQPRKPLTKRNARVGPKSKDSFINDEMSSESERESSYYTAVTNPRTSTDTAQPKPTVARPIGRALRICDTDTEDEGNGEEYNHVHDVRQKKLYFSDDKSESSGTSEFDPGDEVPPKPVVKKDPPKPPRQTIKKGSTIKPILDSRKNGQKYNFLASLSENVPIASAHPDAKKYRTDFKNNKEALCQYLYQLYNEKVFNEQLPKDMSIEWNVRMRGTAGFCYNKKSVKTLGGVVRSSRIVLSTKVLDTPDRLRDTLIHEMCHAAAWLINNVSDGHGPFWTGWAKKATTTFPDLPPIRRCHDYQIKTKFTYKCVNCGYSIGRHSKSLDIERKRCGHCYGKFELLINKTTKSGTVQVQTPKRELGGFALFVKKNYNNVKKERNVKHAEIMKILGQQFSTIKIAKNVGNVENDPDTPG